MTECSHAVVVQVLHVWFFIYTSETSSKKQHRFSYMNNNGCIAVSSFIIFSRFLVSWSEFCTLLVDVSNKITDFTGETRIWFILWLRLWTRAINNIVIFSFLLATSVLMAAAWWNFFVISSKLSKNYMRLRSLHSVHILNVYLYTFKNIDKLWFYHQHSIQILCSQILFD